MEKSNILNGKKLKLMDSKKSVLGNKLDNAWRSPTVKEKIKEESKKLVVKLKTCGKEKRKILLKLEAGGSNIQNGNFSLISELLKEFFKNGKE
jgi:hypothetical protein